MPSPFPGMDPYIERPELWPDFHNNLASEMQAHLNQRFQPRYVARLTPYVTYDILEVATMHSIRPDVGVWQPTPPLGQLGGGTLTITPAPVMSIVPMEVPLQLLTVEIRMVDTDLLVTTIEILSPVNKRRGHDAHIDYQRKRRDLLRSAVHFMEIDLLRAGERFPLERPIPIAPYYVFLSRADRRPRIEVWPLSLKDKLPTLPVPLLEPDPDVPLDLGATFASVYERAAYGAQIDYHRSPPPPALAEPDANWVDSFLRERKLR